MTILEKLNLEPGAHCEIENTWPIAGLLTFGRDDENRAYSALLDIGMNNDTLTNAEFLAACEEWLSKN